MYEKFKMHNVFFLQEEQMFDIMLNITQNAATVKYDLLNHSSVI